MRESAARCRDRQSTGRQVLVGSCLALAGILLFSGTAFASGGNYVFNGGTPYQQQQVRQALAASSFNWGIIPGTITVNITPDFTSEAAPGEIFLDPNLLNSGEFSWGVVQHEYAHQVDFALFDDANHAALTTELGVSAWCYADTPELPHSLYGCERFASLVAWVYWRSPENCMRPSRLAGAESGAITPAAFRALITSLLGADATTSESSQTSWRSSTAWASVRARGGSGWPRYSITRRASASAGSSRPVSSQYGEQPSFAASVRSALPLGRRSPFSNRLT
jgi:hypothetical protein